MIEIKNRFEALVFKPFLNGCHLWCGSIDKYGYGRMCVRSKTGSQKVIRVHRIAYQLYKGKISKGMHVLHSCDIKMCVNPDHLRLGTNTENMRDKAKRYQNFKCSSDVVRSIRNDLKNGLTQLQTANRHGVSRSHVSKIKSKQRRQLV